MSTFAILASGPSMSKPLAESLRGKCGVVAVSDVYRLAPWADAMVAQDAAWWRVHREEAKAFQGKRFCGPRCNPMPEVEVVEAGGLIASGTNSGLLACHVAVKHLGATKLLLCGFDMHGSHFFGPHPAPLKNTNKYRFGVMCDQFKAFRPKGVEILNCTPGSALHCYPTADLCEELGLTFA